MGVLSGKWALVTGASRGVGKQVSAGLAALGCNLVLHSRTLEHTGEQAVALRAQGVQVLCVAAELTDTLQVDTMLDYVLAQTPGIDILYNNAAVMTPWCENPWVTPAEDFRKSFEVNVIALIRICHRLVPPMLERKWGRVINVSSGIQDQPQLTAYAISKAAVDKFVRDFATQLQGSGVQMNLLDPGWLRTDLGGPQAPNAVESVVPGALVPSLLTDGVSGRFFRAQDYAGMSLSDAVSKALKE